MPANTIDECSFRLNEGNCKIHTLQRMENLCKAVKGKDLPTNNLQIKMGRLGKADWFAKVSRSITEKPLFLMSREQNILNCAYSTIRLVKAPAEVSL